MSIYVLLNLLNKLRKSDKMRGLPSILSFFALSLINSIIQEIDGWLRMGLLPPPPPREFCRHILSCRELKAKSFKRCLHSVLRGVSL